MSQQTPPQAGIVRRGVLAVILAALLVTGVLVSAVTGQLDIAASQVLGSILDRLGIATSLAPGDEVIDATCGWCAFLALPWLLPWAQRSQ